MERHPDWEREPQISAMGTVSERFIREGAIAGESLSRWERDLLNHSLQAGLTPADFWATHKIAGLEGPPSRELLGLLLCERLACAEGGTFLQLSQDRLAPYLTLVGWPPEEIPGFLAQISRLLAEHPFLFAFEMAPERAGPFMVVEEGKGLCRHRHYVAEGNIAASLGKRLGYPWQVFSDLKNARARVVARFPQGDGPWNPEPATAPNPLKLSSEQELASLVGVVAPITLITGGPGTGKTSIVVTLLRLLTELEVDPETISLAAPTGRAANRLAEAIHRGLRSVNPLGLPAPLLDWRARPRTLHRLLGWSPSQNRFAHGPASYLPADWVIVDEASMIDISLMEQLLAAIRPEGRLVLLGDARQLPPVEAGAVFRDMVALAGEDLIRDEAADPWLNLERRRSFRQNRLAASVVTLTRTFRQEADSGGAHILAVSEAVEKGKIETLFGGGANRIQSIRTWEAVTWSGVLMASPRDMNLLVLIENLFDKFFSIQKSMAEETFLKETEPSAKARLGSLFESLDRCRILCLTHGTRHGVAWVNRMFSARFGNPERSFQAGIPWMVTSNDYRFGLFNGDIGIGLWFRDEGGAVKPWLVFRAERGYRKIPFASLSGLVPAFAMTVHKSQGAEMDHVVLVLPEKKNALCKKEVIYTALTRARKSVLIFGDRDVFAEGVADHMERASRLAKLIRAGDGNRGT